MKVHCDLEMPACVISQDWTSYSSKEHESWERAIDVLTTKAEGRMCDEFMAGLDALQLPSKQIVDFAELSERLNALTGWQYVAVPGFIPISDFFNLLSQRCFPSSRFMRSYDDIAYQELPDIFHDVFGHAPLLANPTMADFMQQFGIIGSQAMDDASRLRLARLYWYTAEVGLIETGNGLRVYGAAIASSDKEIEFSLSSTSPSRIRFESERVTRTPYSMYDLQETYFVVKNLEEILDVAGSYFPRIAEQTGVDLEFGQILASDHIVNAGDRHYHASKPLSIQS